MSQINNLNFSSYFLYVLILFAVVLSGLFSTIKVDAFSNGNRIVFESTHEGNSEIYTVKTDGSELIRITNNTASDVNPIWSFDGTKIIFSSNRDGSFDLFSMNRDGTNVSKMTSNGQQDHLYPSLNPFGLKVAFASRELGSATPIYSIRDIDTNGANERVLYESDNELQSPSYDGLTSISFKIQTETDHAIFSKSQDAATITRLTQPNPGSDYFPSYNGPASRFIFTRAAANLEIFTMATDGSNATSIISGAQDSRDPKWSPEGDKIVYVSGNSVLTANIDGSSITNVIDGVSPRNPSWQPHSAIIDFNANTGKSILTIPADYTIKGISAVTQNQTMILNGTAEDVQVSDGGVMKGTGLVLNTLTINNSTLAPGLSPGCIETTNLTFTGTSTYEVEIEGTTACSQYDQTRATGSVDIGNATLQIVRGSTFIPEVGNTFTVIDKQSTGPVIGTFNGIAENDTVVIDGVTYQVSYVGGDGNDVVLTVTAVDPSLNPGTPDTGFGILSSNPTVTALVTAISALSIVAIARRTQTKQK